MKGRRNTTSSSSDLDPPSKCPARRAAPSTRVREDRNVNDNTDTAREPVGENQQDTDTDDHEDQHDQHDDTATDKNDNTNVTGNAKNHGLIANMVMKILARLTPAEISSFRHQPMRMGELLRFLPSTKSAQIPGLSSQDSYRATKKCGKAKRKKTLSQPIMIYR